MMKYLLVAIAAIFFSSCVTQKKYDDLAARKSALEVEHDECSGQLEMAQAENERLNEQVVDLTDQVKRLKMDTTETGRFLRRTLANYRQLESSYEKLLKNHERLQSNSASENSKLSGDLARREADLMESQKEINELRADLEAREQRVAELEQVLDEKDKVVQQLKERVTNALLGFREKDLSVDVKNGKVYVSLSEQLLFKSGSSKVDKKGKEALQKLGAVLKEQGDMSVMVEGHTDDVPIVPGTRGMEDNWDLSVLRATSIIRILTEAGVDPDKLIAAGRGEHHPVEEGESPEARRKNRRTEIILTPKLDELFQILEAN